MVIVTKIITVINIMTVLLKCAVNVQKVLTHKSFNQVLYLKLNYLIMCIQINVNFEKVS